MLSFALMVKNERENLERCLRSVLPFSSEIIVLDTGSTDNTVEIAKKFTNKIYHQEWQNDFALHRNKSFSFATGDWIFQIDADEEIVYENDKAPAVFLKFLEKLPAEVNAVAFPLRDFRKSTGTYAAEFDVARCFRKGKVKYHRKIHNRPDYEGSVTYFDMLFLKHYGYDMTEEQRKRKSERTIGLLLDSINEDPSDYESYFYLCQAYMQLDNNKEKSLEYGLKYIDLKNLLGAEFNQAVYHTVAALYMDQNELVKAGEIIKQGLAANNKNPDLWFDTLKIAVKTKAMKSIAMAAQNYIVAIRELRKTRTSTLGGQFFFYTDSDSVASGLYYLAMCYFENGVMELRNLKNILKFCTNKTQGEIQARITEDLKTMQIDDLSERKLIIPADSASMAAASFMGG